MYIWKQKQYQYNYISLIIQARIHLFHYYIIIIKTAVNYEVTKMNSTWYPGIFK